MGILYRILLFRVLKLLKMLGYKIKIKKLEHAVLLNLYAKRTTNTTRCTLIVRIKELASAIWHMKWVSISFKILVIVQWYVFITTKFKRNRCFCWKLCKKHDLMVRFDLEHTWWDLLKTNRIVLQQCAC